MDQPHYEVQRSLQNYVYSFVSEGRKGRVKKKVQFDLMQAGIFNLGFGDWKDSDSGFDDLAITDNGDMEIVLSTVVRIAVEFLSENPGVIIHLTGSTPARTRLYRIIISNRYDAIRNGYSVWGYLNGGFHPFQKNINYEAFLISKLL
ncbi:MAG: hypothetical protein J7619_25550 [Dyadobacter sp.]|uniref:DUF6934 family protein n=1 Tax=Dyadobacter sp. TaxID=1914288 RepID=UPI001B0EF095|nr:hypothetical protein [Dyadobacter sp.]MBO9616085.1 hypothetical protein [Dyadobacter sp.]